MSYNEQTEDRIRKIVSKWKGVSSRTMFGGVCHLLNGNMFCGVYKDFLILRLGKKGALEALRSEYARPLDITGRPMKGWVMIRPEGFESDEVLHEWLNEAKDFAETLTKRSKAESTNQRNLSKKPEGVPDSGPNRDDG